MGGPRERAPVATKALAAMGEEARQLRLHPEGRGGDAMPAFLRQERRGIFRA